MKFFVFNVLGHFSHLGQILACLSTTIASLDNIPLGALGEGEGIELTANSQLQNCEEAPRRAH